jgi:carboxypeptidase Taq
MEVMMPRKSEQLRAEQLSILHTLSQELLLGSKVKPLLREANLERDTLDAFARRNLALMTHQHTILTALPPKFIYKLNSAINKADSAWLTARDASDFSLFEQPFAELVKLIKEKAHRLSDKLGIAPYEALMDEYDPGRKQSDIDQVFGEIKAFYPAIIHSAKERFNTEIPLDLQKYDKRAQMALCKELLQLLHFPLDKGRLDESVHPFTEGIQDDIRITTIFDRKNPLNTIMGLMHELGHALYDNALPVPYRFQLVGQDAGMVIHEGIALFWEKMLGASSPFSKWLSQHLTMHFPQTNWDPSAIYQKLNAINPYAARIDADEICYLAHIILRYEVEKALLSGEVSVKHLPDFWQSKLLSLLGIQKANPEIDCLQDIHWAQGYFGYFHTYGLGFLFAAQIHQILHKENPSLLTQLIFDNSKPLLDWFKVNIFSLGAFLTADELIENVTKTPLSWQPCLKYFQNKYTLPNKV